AAHWNVGNAVRNASPIRQEILHKMALDSWNHGRNLLPGATKTIDLRNIEMESCQSECAPHHDNSEYDDGSVWFGGRRPFHLSIDRSPHYHCNRENEHVQGSEQS